MTNGGSSNNCSNSRHPVFVQGRPQTLVEPAARDGSSPAQLRPGQIQEGLRLLKLIGLEGGSFFFSSG